MWRFRLSPSENQEWQAGKTFATRDYVSARAQLEAATNFEEYERSGLTNLYSQLLMIDTLRMLSGDTIRIERLDTAAQLILQQFAESGTEAGAVQAKNLLSFFYDYRYPLIYPNMNTPKKATKTTNSAGGKTTFTEVKVYPNPAKDFVIIEWKERDGFKPQRVQFVSATGAVLWQSAVRSGAGSIVCPVTGIARGTIYYNLSDSSGKVLSSGSILLN